MIPQKVKNTWRFIEWFLVLRIVSALFHELAHFYSFILLNDGNVSIEFEFYIVTSALRELDIFTIFFFGPWLQGVVSVETPLHPLQWQWQFTLYLLSGVIVQLLVYSLYCKYRFEKLHMKLGLICLGSFPILLGSTADIELLYYYLGYNFLYIYLTHMNEILLYLFYSGWTFLMWPHISSVYTSTRKQIVGAI